MNSSTNFILSINEDFFFFFFTEYANAQFDFVLKQGSIEKDGFRNANSRKDEER